MRNARASSFASIATTGPSMTTAALRRERRSRLAMRPPCVASRPSSRRWRRCPVGVSGRQRSRAQRAQGFPRRVTRKSLRAKARRSAAVIHTRRTWLSRAVEPRSAASRRVLQLAAIPHGNRGIRQEGFRRWCRRAVAESGRALVHRFTAYPQPMRSPENPARSGTARPTPVARRPV